MQVASLGAVVPSFHKNRLGESLLFCLGMRNAPDKRHGMDAVATLDAVSVSPQHRLTLTTCQGPPNCRGQYTARYSSVNVKPSLLRRAGVEGTVPPSRSPMVDYRIFSCHESFLLICDPIYGIRTAGEAVSSYVQCPPRSPAFLGERAGGSVCICRTEMPWWSMCV
jgi:hypothetical protein